MQLWGSPTSPYVRKVRVFAIERGVPLNFEKEDPWQKSPRLLAANPLGKVPVLFMDDGRIVFDSLAIIEVLDEIAPTGDRMLPLSGPERWDAMRWHTLAHGIIDAVVNRLLETRRPTEFQMAARMQAEEKRFASIMAFAEKHAGTLRTSGGANPPFAAIMMGVALRYTDLRYTPTWRESHPRLAELVAELAERPSFKETDPPI